jgi:hypothetical protein
MMPPSPDPPSDEPLPPTYAIRILPGARGEIDQAMLRLADMAGEQIARQWYQGLLNTLASLAAAPRQFPIIPEVRRFRREVRQIVYRRTASSVAYRLLFVIEDESADGPRVTVFHVRHAGRRPLKAREARAWDEEL